MKELPGYRRAVKARAEMLAAMASDGARLTEQALGSGDPGAAASVVRLLKRALSEAEGTDRGQRGQWQFNLGRAHAAVWQLTGDADALTSAIDAFLGAIALGLSDRLGAASHLNLAFAYAQRYNGADGLLDDLNAAVTVLELAAPPDDAPELTRECQQSLQNALWNRYMATADLADLERAIQIARSLLAGGRPAGKSRKAAHLTRRRTLPSCAPGFCWSGRHSGFDARVSSEIAALSGARANPPVSPTPRRNCWAGAVPMTDQDHESGEARDEAGRRVLVLRTFKELSADIVAPTAIAAALESRGRIVLVGDGQDEAALAVGWDRVLGATHAFDDRVEYVHSTGEHWTTTVLGEMCVADTVVLHLSPKGRAVPHVFRPPDLQHSFPQQAFATLQHSAGTAEQEAARRL